MCNPTDLQAGAAVQRDLAEQVQPAILACQWSLQVDSPHYLASGEESIDVTFVLTDPRNEVNVLRFRIYDRAANIVYERPITPDERQNARVAWNGTVDPDGAFPAQRATIQRSPYQAAIYASDGARSRVRVSMVCVEVQSFTLERLPVDDEAVVEVVRHRAVYHAMAAVPAEGDTHRVVLRSNLFSVGIGDKGENDATSFDRYRVLWADGPTIPLLAVVKVRSNAIGGGRVAPLALGAARILWDYEDLGGDAGNLHERGRSFVDDASDYSVESSSPPGRNCHADRGGKRAANPAAAQRVLPPSAAWGGFVTGAFNFVVVAAGTRAWASYSTPSTDGAYRGKAGIVFRPSRIAGDSYRLTAHLDVDGSLDRLGAIAAQHRARTGIFATWREVDIAKVFLKGDASDFDLPTIQRFYDPAFVRINRIEQAPIPMRAERYNPTFRDSIQNYEGEDDHDTTLVELAINTPLTQFSGTSAAMKFLSKRAFEEAFIAARTTQHLIGQEVLQNEERYRNFTGWKEKNPAAKAHLTQQARNRLGALYNAKRGSPTQTEDSIYLSATDTIATIITNDACIRMTDADDAPEGVLVFGFNWTMNQLSDDTGSTFGMVVARDDYNQPVKVAYMQFGTASYYARTPNHSISNTMAHEVGHLLFLPHTKSEGQAAKPNAHDFADDACVMSYHHTVTKHFCGYCLLRLRGWDHTRIRCGTADRPRQNARRPKLTTTMSAFETQGHREVAFLTLQNDGDADLVVQAFALQDGDGYQIDPQPAIPGRVVPPGQTTRVQISYAPMVEGCSARITTNADPQPRIVPFSGSGRCAEVLAAPARLDFPDTYLAENSALVLRLTGRGPEPTLRSVQILGPDASQFQLAGPAVGGGLAVGGGRDYTITFQPNADGEKIAHVRVESDSVTGPITVPLKAKALISRRYTVACPATFNIQRWLTATRVITITSTGTQPLTISGITKANAIASDKITITRVPAFPVTLTNGQTTTFEVTYTAPPHVARGAREQQRIDIDSDSVGTMPEVLIVIPAE